MQVHSESFGFGDLPWEATVGRPEIGLMSKVIQGQGQILGHPRQLAD